jgi:hypothetical protein
MVSNGAIFKKLPKANNHPMGEFRPNLVTLVSAKIGFCPKEKSSIWGDTLKTKCSIRGATLSKILPKTFRTILPVQPGLPDGLFSNQKSQFG